MQDLISERDPRTDPIRGDVLRIGPYEYRATLVLDLYVCYRLSRNNRNLPMQRRAFIGAWREYMAFATIEKRGDE